MLQCYIMGQEFNAKLSIFSYAEEVRICYETALGRNYGPYEYIGHASPDYRALGLAIWDMSILFGV